MPIANARIYELGENEFEAKHSKEGWYTSKQNIKQIRQINKISDRGQSPDYEKNRQKTIIRARGKIRRKIKKYRLERFWTLTFAENLQGVSEADKKFRNLMKRIDRRYPGFKYSAPENFKNAAQYIII